MGDQEYVLFFPRAGMFLSGCHGVTPNLREARVFGSVDEALDMIGRPVSLPFVYRPNTLDVSEADLITMAEAKRIPWHLLGRVAGV